MTPRQLKTLGELLYGRRWKTYLANDLGVDRRTVMCWFQKEWTMPAARAKAVVGLASERIVAIRAALKGTAARGHRPPRQRSGEPKTAGAARAPFAVQDVIWITPIRSRCPP